MRKKVGIARVLDMEKGRYVKVGDIYEQDGCRILCKRVNTEKHLHRNYDAWGVQSFLFESLQNGGQDIAVVELKDENGHVFRASRELFLERGFEQEYKKHGKQIFLRRKFWTSIQERFQRDCQGNQEGEDVQDLFRGRIDEQDV